ncbi:Na+/solute symporter [Sulfurimonas gotlandica GD1]|uniref:Na+/solute symporter n=1 Tax=Sulfurimonas gotlandica (strain DSM 19862 / JCM 16533 / GD1) TaxID=929558 RepID=B6BMK5_SULGG|nr:sodium:solute symporter family protein [Sulfurimonas gotlandica]EDZ61549.1 sodium:pantothenate symporter [Sulfurimonas gotlandica GD1]EHP30880.1 Na+/solute symporter [Sulfurimonas gotlandica GD1]
MTNTALLSEDGIWFLVAYLASLILIGFAGKFASKEESLKDFYLGGKGFGVGVLFLTMYATQYSGNSLIGFAGSAYRNGWFFLVGVTFMIAIVAGYLIYAPKLFPISKKHGFITVGDYINFRYNSQTLTYLIVGISIFALSNYMLTNLKAIGYIIEYVTGGGIGFTEGIIFMAIIMVIYETLGGMRSVAWTDAIQGVLLFVGVIIIFSVIMINYGSIDANTALFLQNQPDLFADVTTANQITWISVLILIFFGISVYPQAIQRIYSAKNESTLRRSLSLMIIMPLLTTLPLIIIAIIGSAHFPELDKAGSEQIILLMLNKLTHIEGMSIVITIFVAAAIAAIMSTVDSAMLAIASLFTQDIYHKQNPQASQKKLTYVGKVFSWIIMALMVVLAVNLPSTIWWLIQMKLEILVHIAPAIMLGIHFKKLSHKSILYGLLTGVGITLIFLLTSLPSKPFGFHAGVVGLLLNFLVVYFHHRKKS